MSRVNEPRSVPFASPMLAAGVALLALLVALATFATGCGGDAPGTTVTATDSATSGIATTTLAAPTSTTTTSSNTTTSTVPSAGDPSVTTVTYSPPYTGTTLQGVPLPPLESNALAKELKRTSLAAAQLAAKLEEAHTPQDDPQVATIYALRARAQALTARRAIVDGAMPLADLASSQIGKMLARATAVAQGETAASVAQAQEHMKALKLPSANAVEAASTLDYVIRDLAPLVPADSTTG